MEKIVIYTWGNKIYKTCPVKSNFNLNVCGISSYKPRGVNLKKVDGRSSILQEKIQRGKNYDYYMDIFIEKVKTGAKILSINCHKGRHRSVAMAEMVGKKLSQLGYSVELHHLNLK